MGPPWLRRVLGAESTLYCLRLSLRKSLRAAESPAHHTARVHRPGDLATPSISKGVRPCAFPAFPSFQHHWARPATALIVDFSSSEWPSIILHSQGKMGHMQFHVDFTTYEMSPQFSPTSKQAWLTNDILTFIQVRFPEGTPTATPDPHPSRTEFLK